MQLPNVKHPTLFAIKGIKFQVMTYLPLTDAQAAKVAMHAYRSKKWKGSDKGKLVTIPWLGDQETAEML